jgi:hypothetical protein
VTSRWWYGVAVGAAAWVLALAPLDALDAAGFGAVSTALAVGAVLAWPLVPGTLYLDRRATADATAWNPRTRLWLLAAAVPFAAAAAGTAYCLRRASALRGTVPSTRWRPLAYAGVAGWTVVVVADAIDPALGVAGDVLFGPVLWLVALGTPVALYLDAVRARAYTDLAPRLPALVALSAVPLVNLLVGLAYVAGREYHRRGADPDAEPTLPSADDGRPAPVSPWYRRAVAVVALYLGVVVALGAAVPSASEGALGIASLFAWPPFGLAFAVCYYHDSRAVVDAGVGWGKLTRYGFYLGALLPALAAWYLLVRYTAVTRARREGRLRGADDPTRGEAADHEAGELPRVGRADVDSSIRLDDEHGAGEHGVDDRVPPAGERRGRTTDSPGDGQTADADHGTTYAGADWPAGEDRTADATGDDERAHDGTGDGEQVAGATDGDRADESPEDGDPAVEDSGFVWGDEDA